MPPVFLLDNVPPTSLTSYINSSGTSDHVNPGKDKDTYRNKKTNTTPIFLDNAVAALWIMCPHLTSLTSYINSSGTSGHVNDVKEQLVSSLTSKLSFRDTREHADHFFLIAINILLQNEVGRSL